MVSNKLLVTSSRNKRLVAFHRNRLLGNVSIALRHIEMVKNSGYVTDLEIARCETAIQFIKEIDNTMRLNKSEVVEIVNHEKV